MSTIECITRRVDLMPDFSRDCRLEPGIDHELHDVVVEPERDDTRRELSALHLTCYREECVRKIDYNAAEGYFRRNVVLIGVRPDDAYVLRFLRCLKHT